ncbi:MAG: hypothetical protein F6K24_01300 [Okeania sp. SIO2D1]|nr:hypothetical protein [Okeania sp. SIO2D1]
MRFLLQCRLLSQIVTYTWLETKQIQKRKREEVQFVRKIFDEYNISPEVYWENDQTEPFNDIHIERKLLEIKENNQELLSYLILPTSMSYGSIALALLLSGQAYYRKEPGNNKLEMIWEPIFSTYEMIWEYAMDVSWDTFYATRIDLSRTGLTPEPPYTKVTLGYPPKPNEFSLDKNQIKEWATAEEYPVEDNKFPFYPQEGTPDWENQQLQFVFPPYPYVTLSCS